MLKLRYFWKIEHATERKVTHQVYKGLRKNFLKGNQGYIHEVFNLCCKYGRMDLWHGQCPKKVNPMLRIRKIVEEYHLSRDLETARKVDCIYTKTIDLKIKKYKFDERLTKLGTFQTTVHRRVFLHAILESNKIERKCSNCGQPTMNITKHGLKDFKAVDVNHHRTIYIQIGNEIV